MTTGISRPSDPCYFDIAVCDTGAASYLGRKSLSVLADKAKRKRAKYGERVERVGGCFAPLVCSVYGTLEPEAAKILTLVVNGLDEERPERASSARLQRVALQVATLKATSLCLRARRLAVPDEDEGDEEPLEPIDDCHVGLADSRPPADH